MEQTMGFACNGRGAGEAMDAPRSGPAEMVTLVREARSFASEGDRASRHGLAMLDAALEALWNRVLSLPSWHFVAIASDAAEQDAVDGPAAADVMQEGATIAPEQASDDLARPPRGRSLMLGARPEVVERDGRRVLLVFTDEFGALRHQARRMGEGGGGQVAGPVGGSALGPSAGSTGETLAAETPMDGHGEFLPHGAHAPLATLELRLGTALRLVTAMAPRRERDVAGSDQDGLRGALSSPTPITVQEVVFDEGAHGFSIPAAALAMLAEEALSRETPEGFAPPPPRAADDPIASRLRAARRCTLLLPFSGIDLAPQLNAARRDASARPAALRLLCGLSDWWFICNPREPEAVYVRRLEGATSVPIFTDERLAMQAVERFGLLDDSGSMVLLQLPLPDARHWLRGFLEHDVRQVVFDPLTTPLALEIEMVMGVSP